MPTHEKPSQVACELMPSLEGLNVIITRPLHLSHGLKESISRYQGCPIIFPTLKITGLKSRQALRKIINHINAYDLIIFTSQNAVAQVAPFWPSTYKASIAAIGPATAKALMAQKIRVHILPVSPYTSESLLALPAFKELAGKQIVIFAGEGGRDFLQEKLTLKKAIVQKVAVYQRQLPRVDPALIRRMVTFASRIIISTSCESLQNLLYVMKTYQQESWLYQTPLLIISMKMRQFALQHGFKEDLLVMAENATDEAILMSLIKWYA